MGNILSYFFPQPAPASIEQVVEEVAEDVAKPKKATEEPASPAQEDIGVINDPITADLVLEKEFEVVEDAKVVSSEQADEQLEADIQEDLPAVKETSPEPDTATHEYVSDEASETVNNQVTQEKGIMITEVEMIGSIQNSGVVEDVIANEDTVSQTSEPMKPTTSELEVVAPTPELPTAPTPETALTTESIIIPPPESSKAPAPELSIASTPEDAIIPPKAVSIPTPEPARTPELPKASSTESVNAIPHKAIKDTIPESAKAQTPELPEVSFPGPGNIIPPDALNISPPSSAPEVPKASSPESVNAPPEVIQVEECPEPTKAPGSDLLDVEVIGLIEQNKDGQDEEELSDGASGLKNLLTGAID